MIANTISLVTTVNLVLYYFTHHNMHPFTASPCHRYSYYPQPNYSTSNPTAPTRTATAPPKRKAFAPPVNGTTLGPSGTPVPVGAGAEELGSRVGWAEDVRTAVVDTGAEEGAEVGAAELAGPAGTVWPGLKPLGRVTPFWLAQVAGSSPCCRRVSEGIRDDDDIEITSEW